MPRQKQIRIAKVKTQHFVIKRPVSKLCLIVNKHWQNVTPFSCHGLKFFDSAVLDFEFLEFIYVKHWISPAFA